MQTTSETKRKCRFCGYTDDDISKDIERTGKPRFWVEDDRCSDCISETDKFILALFPNIKKDEK